MQIKILIYANKFARLQTFAKSKKADAEQFSCSDGKRTCKDMDNCDDAKFHLRECGMHKLDRDHDGVPCESICG